MAGRRPLSIADKLARGNPGKRPLNLAEPKVEAGVPPCPSHLSEPAKKAFRSIGKRLNEAKVISKNEGVALELLADAYAEWRAAREVVEREGSTYETFIEVPNDDPNATIAERTVVRGKIKVNPEVQIARDAWRRVKLMLSEFGLTPATRPKIHALGETAAPDKFEDLLSRKHA